jgi:hypothetical protein
MVDRAGSAGLIGLSVHRAGETDKETWYTIYLK